MAVCEGVLGAVLVRERGEAAERLAAELAENWSIRVAHSARDVLRGMLLEAHSLALDEDFRRLQRNEPSAFDGEQRLRWQRAKQAWLKTGLALPKNLFMAAYDCECIAWLARRSHACGYLTEAEAWLCLAWVAEAAIRGFSDWQAYAASYVLVRAPCSMIVSRSCWRSLPKSPTCTGFGSPATGAPMIAPRSLAERTAGMCRWLVGALPSRIELEAFSVVARRRDVLG